MCSRHGELNGADAVGARCESGWTGDRCQLPLGHDGPHDNEDEGKRRRLVAEEDAWLQQQDERWEAADAEARDRQIGEDEEDRFWNGYASKFGAQ